ncbi:MAG: transketolase [bacterium]|nr:transketolase [bacterium]
MLSNKEIIYLTKLSKEIRKQILKMIVKATASHIGPSYSIVELLVYLYEKVLKINPKKPYDPNRDKFILSKGWAVSGLYSILAYKGFFDKKLLDDYCIDGGKMIAMTTINDIPGIEVTTGSAGHGLPIGAGMAMAMKLKKLNRRVYVIIGDGECDEGSIWETALIASHHKLNNLIAIIDYNKWQSFGRTNEVLNLEPFKEKWQAFNWQVIEIDGHNFQEIAYAIKTSHQSKTKPTVIIANTIKGKGLSIIEDKNEYHYRTPRTEELEVAKKEGLI